MSFMKCFSLIIFVSFLNYSNGTGPKHGKVVVCYIGTWAVYRPNRGSFSLGHLDPSLCTHVIYSFAGLDTKQDTIKALDLYQDLTEDYGQGGFQRITQLRINYPHLKVSLALGGWNEGSLNYSLLVANAARRGRFVTNSVEFLKKYNFDGLDLDWEFPGKRGGTPEDKLNFLLLVKELRAAFRKHGLLLTAALGAGKDTIDGGYDVPGLSVYLDYLHLMCYDYHGAWDRKTGPNAPLRGSDVLTVEYTINYMLQLGAPANKLIMGLPLYGRTFLTEEENNQTRKPKLGVVAQNAGFSGPFTRENGFMGYNEICLALKNKTEGYTTYWDAESRTPYAVSGNRWIAYDNEQSISEKVYFAMDKGLAGAMVWSVDTDDFQGDCSEDDVNFPLMRCINKSITQALKEKENTIIHGKEAAVSRGQRSQAIVPLLLFLGLFCWSS